MPHVVRPGLWCVVFMPHVAGPATRTLMCECRMISACSRSEARGEAAASVCVCVMTVIQPSYPRVLVPAPCCIGCGHAVHRRLLGEKKCAFCPTRASQCVLPPLLCVIPCRQSPAVLAAPVPKECVAITRCSSSFIHSHCTGTHALFLVIEVCAVSGLTYSLASRHTARCVRIEEERQRKLGRELVHLNSGQLYPSCRPVPLKLEKLG
eukprot:scaffold44181_cov18-Tisochrysis_lutea.AAC.1